MGATVFGKCCDRIGSPFRGYPKEIIPTAGSGTSASAYVVTKPLIECPPTNVFKSGQLRSPNVNAALTVSMRTSSSSTGISVNGTKSGWQEYGYSNRRVAMRKEPSTSLSAAIKGTCIVDPEP